MIASKNEAKEVSLPCTKNPFWQPHHLQKCTRKRASSETPSGPETPVFTLAAVHSVVSQSLKAEAQLQTIQFKLEIA